ncbi:MAG: hypothetical protein AB1758_16335 [Candidatus Eremiobacterota bacterium]
MARLRILIHVHDTFKPQACDVAIVHPTSHASLARAFLQEFTADRDLLDCVQYHDEGYALWRQWRHRGSYREERLQALFQVIRDWDLFLAFCVLDGCTAGKSREPLGWFLELVTPRVSSRVGPDWIL